MALKKTGKNHHLPGRIAGLIASSALVTALATVSLPAPALAASNAGPCGMTGQQRLAESVRKQITSAAKTFGSAGSSFFGSSGSSNADTLYENWGSAVLSATGISSAFDGLNGLVQGKISLGTPPWLSGQPGQMPVLSGHTKTLNLVTGPGSPQDTDNKWKVAGTDLGISFADDKGQTYLVFGDTFSCLEESDGWRSNAILRTTDTNYADGLNVVDALTASGYKTSGKAVEFIPSKYKDPNQGEHTVIPTGGIYLNGKYYVDFMSVQSWGDPGVWVTNYAATMESTDAVNWKLVPSSLRVLPTVSWNIRDDLSGYSYTPSSSYANRQMSAFVTDPQDPNYLYRFTTPSGRQGGAILGRIAKTDFPDESKFEFYNGTSWTTDSNLAQNTLLSPVSELSVMWHPGIKKFVAMYSTSDGDTNGAAKGMVIQVADSLTGPWSKRYMLVDTDTVADLYGGMILPNQTGNKLSFVATTWSSYNVMMMETNLDELFAGTQSDLAKQQAAGGKPFDPSKDDGLAVVRVIDYRQQQR